MLTPEMKRALEADGEKLRQLTGEDHGPCFLADEPEIVPVTVVCEACGGEGRKLSGQYEDEQDHGPCEYCEGGRAIVPTEPLTEADVRQINEDLSLPQNHEAVCVERCQYAIDIAMPEYSCSGQCQYEIAKDRR